MAIQASLALTDSKCPVRAWASSSSSVIPALRSALARAVRTSVGDASTAVERSFCNAVIGSSPLCSQGWTRLNAIFPLLQAQLCRDSLTDRKQDHASPDLAVNRPISAPTRQRRRRRDAHITAVRPVGLPVSDTRRLRLTAAVYHRDAPTPHKSNAGPVAATSRGNIARDSAYAAVGVKNAHSATNGDSADHCAQHVPATPNGVAVRRDASSTSTSSSSANS